MAREIDKQFILDRHFFVPPGVIDVRQDNTEEGNTYYSNPEDVAVEGPVLDTPDSTIPSPPTTFTIVEQRVRITSDGRAVVDMVLEFPDVSGVESIEVRITKT